jgi:hypothetical protein
MKEAPMPRPRTKCISTKVTDEEYATLERLAGDRTLSEWVRGRSSRRGHWQLGRRPI